MAICSIKDIKFQNIWVECNTTFIVRLDYIPQKSFDSPFPTSLAISIDRISFEKILFPIRDFSFNYLQDKEKEALDTF